MGKHRTGYPLINTKKQTRWADVSKTQLHQLGQQLCKARFNIRGKSTFKEEFVTAGGIDLKKIDFKTMCSKILPDVYFAGEMSL